MLGPFWIVMKYIIKINYWLTRRKYFEERIVLDSCSAIARACRLFVFMYWPPRLGIA